MARKLTQNDVKNILLNIISECKDCSKCVDCKQKKLESIIRDLEDIKDDNGLNYLGSEFIDNQLPKLQKSLCTGSSLQREKLISDCVKSISLNNKSNNKKRSVTSSKKSFLEKLFG